MVLVLPERPDLDQLRRQAKQLLAAARAGDPVAGRQLAEVGAAVPATLAFAQLALARSYGFPSWARLGQEVRRKRLIASGDVAGLRALVRRHPRLALDPVSSRLTSASMRAIDYVAVARFHGALDADAAGDLARVLLEAGAGTDGAGDPPLVTAASYGELDMVRALVAAGARLDSRGSSIPGGGTALAHAVHYAMPEVVDALVAAGSAVHGIVEQAGVGTLDPAAVAAAGRAESARALRAAAVCGRVGTLDWLLAAGVDVDARTEGGTALHWAGWHARAAGIELLLARGADPAARDDEHNMTPVGWYRYRREQLREIRNPRADRDAGRIERAFAAAGQGRMTGD